MNEDDGEFEDFEVVTDMPCAAEIDAIAAVMNEVMEVVFSRIDEAPARPRVQEILSANPDQRPEVEDYVRRAFDQRPSYISTRAYHLVIDPGDDVSRESQRVFEAERELGWMPLRAAFARLAKKRVPLGGYGANRPP